MEVEAHAYFLFGGAALFFMGLGLALDAEVHARAALEWQRQATLQGSGAGAPGRASPWLSRLCRLGGLLLCACGAWILAGLWVFPERLAEQFKPPRLGFPGRLACGAFFTLCGMLLSALKMWEWAKPRGWSWLEEEPSPRGWRGRVSFWSGWLVILCFFSLGAFLLSRLPLAAR